MKKYELLQAMNTIISSLNNEEAYWKWTDVIPDGATKQDIKDIASDSDLEYMNVICKVFKILLDEYIEDGYYVDGELIG
jgi:hypothetical protein